MIHPVVGMLFFLNNTGTMQMLVASKSTFNPRLFLFFIARRYLDLYRLCATLIYLKLDWLLLVFDPQPD